MRGILKIALGVIAAIGGYLDIGDIVFNSQAGAVVGTSVLWAIPVGVLGIVVFAEMSGRIVAVAKKPNFELVRERYSSRLSLATLIASLVLTCLTLAAELGGLGFVLNYFFDVSVNFFVLVALLVVASAIYFLPFGGIERIFGYLGLALLVYVAAAIKLDPSWADVGRGFVPKAQSGAIYWYFIVGLIAAALMPYEIYFYSSGAVEERWDEGDMAVNRANSIIGFSLGGLLAAGLLIASAQVLRPAGITPDSLGTSALVAQSAFGETGLLLAFVGILFAVGGATIDTAFSAAYNLAQHQGWRWGKRFKLLDEPRFTLSLAGFLLLGFAIVQTGVDPVELTEYAVIFSIPVLPLTYLPILLVGNDRAVMGRYVNGPLARTLGWTYFGLICLLAIAAPILFVATNGGS
ncbi:MAG TPA: divalent metal cation transporter [Conexibacter sp.]|jgi:Mn2+/Fe2+ NRAMP family transporter|nr:divalent metal cation transporter [Conexibacter sp.]